jgi:hypothetical protein
MTKEELQKRIDELKLKREEVLLEVNRLLGEINGKISVYQEFLTSEMEKTNEE